MAVNEGNKGLKKGAVRNQRRQKGLVERGG